MPAESERRRLSAAVRYGGYGKHKRNASVWGVASYHGDADDATYCEDAGLIPSDLARATRVIGRGIAAGLFGDRLDNGNPTILWTIDDNGWIYELRLTNRVQALYHGYPVRFRDAMARLVIARFDEWVLLKATVGLVASPSDRSALQAAQNLYT
jgi:hypothetical protein